MKVSYCKEEDDDYEMRGREGSVRMTVWSMRSKAIHTVLQNHFSKKQNCYENLKLGSTSDFYCQLLLSFSPTPQPRHSYDSTLSTRITYPLFPHTHHIDLSSQHNNSTLWFKVVRTSPNLPCLKITRLRITTILPFGLRLYE